MKPSPTQIIVPILIAIPLLFGAYQLGVKNGHQSAQPTTNQSAKPDRKILYWHDPMTPNAKFDKPGKSPFMDMDLVPVYADEQSGDGNSGVTIDPRTQQNLGVRIGEVTQSSPEGLSTNIMAVGTVVYNERDTHLVQARSNGFIEKLYVRANFDPVQKGQALAELYVPDWVAAQEEFLNIKNMPNAVTGLLDGARQRMRLAGMTEQQIHALEANGKVQARITISAPSSGIVTELNAREGMTVMLGAPLFRINGISQVWINAEIPENAITQVHVGTSVEVQSAVLNGGSLRGKVSAILPDVNPSTRTIKARIEVANAQQKLLPGMFVQLKLSHNKQNAASALQVPTEAVIPTGTRHVVIIAEGAGHFSPVTVQTGSSANGFTEIKNGLTLGQKVVLSGQFLIDSEANLKATTEHMKALPTVDLNGGKK